MQGDLYYDAEVADVILGKTSTGKEQLAIVFNIQSIEAGAPQALTAYRFFTPNAIPYTTADLKTLGWDPEAHAWDLLDLTEGRRLIGARASLVCAWETYEGTERLKVKFINTPGAGAGGVKERMEPAEAAAFQARLRASLGITGPAAPMTPAATAAAVGEAFGDDDIPF